MACIRNQLKVHREAHRLSHKGAFIITKANKNLATLAFHGSISFMETSLDSGF